VIQSIQAKRLLKMRSARRNATLASCREQALAHAETDGTLCAFCSPTSTATWLDLMNSNTHSPSQLDGILTPQRTRDLGLKSSGLPWPERRDIGVSRRAALPPEALGGWVAPADRADPVARLLEGNVGRDAALVPLRMSRMASSPFAFLRGSASVMAADLATSSPSGLDVILDGDAHFNNFGLFGTPDAQVVVDLNDFDEVCIGPWEWDLKRLTASIEVAGRQIGLNQAMRMHAVSGATAGYCSQMHAMASMPVLPLWQRRTAVGELMGEFTTASRGRWVADDAAHTMLRKAEEKARQSNNEALMNSMTRADKKLGRVFLEQPPILTKPDAATRQRVAEALNEYVETLSLERRFMLQRYRVVDVAHRVVGVGSVGLRAYCVLMLGNDGDDALFLQVKQAAAPVHAAFAPALPKDFKHDGRRVVYGQRLMQAVGDPMLGWTSIDGLPFYVRQMRNLKGSFVPEKMTDATFAAFSWSFGALLARAHARTGDAAAISGYCGSGTDGDEALDLAMQSWARAYADQTEADHAQLVAAIASGAVPSASDAGDSN
jgi:uncharacterized protein (DUF2252 family)